MRPAAFAILAVAGCFIAHTCEAGEARSGVSLAPGPCWNAPQPQTVEEAVIASQNEAQRAARPKAVGPPAMLALSDGRLKTAYSAGLIVGWGETGRRPEFAVVTAVGMSALIAPFAFLGQQGDAAIADIFACEAASAQDMAHHAAAYLSDDVVERIALRHRAGARLFVALPGSAARSETVWDLGAIAASRHRDARRLIADILLASVDMTSYVDPETASLKAGLKAVRNPALRRLGAGEAFLSAPNLRAPPVPTYLIHNGVLFADEGQEYAAAQTLGRSGGPAGAWLLPAYDLFSDAQRANTPTLIASPRAYMNIQPQQSAFDLTYMRALFLHAFRQGRMNREWRPTLMDPRSR